MQKRARPQNRHTRIICTLGPATRLPKVILNLVEAGMDFARLNFSHNKAEEHIETARRVREAAHKAGREIKVIQDLQGPKLRIEKLKHPLHFRTGEKAVLARKATRPDDIPVAHPDLLTWIHPGQRIFLDDGAVELEALKIHEGRIDCTVLIGGRVDSHSGIQLPGAHLLIPTLSPKDLDDIKTGRKIGADVVAQSMVSRREDVDRLKAFIGKTTPIIAKIETAGALPNLKGIAKSAWGLMVARGDLGVSIPRAQVPLWQKEILAICRRQKRFGIVATEMLLSMVNRHRPTRAEVSDVATAVLDGADAVMLSEETAIGAYPVEAVREMRETIETVEASRWYRRHG